MQSACPVFDTTFGGSAKYNQILGRDVDNFNNFDRFNTTENRFDNRFDGRFDRFNNFDNNMWMNRFNNFDGRFDNRFDGRFDRFNHFDNNMWMNRFNNFDGRFNHFDNNNMWWNRFNNFDGRFDNRFDGRFDRFNHFDGRFDNRFNNFDNFMWWNRFNNFDNNMWMNRFDGRFDNMDRFNRFNTFDRFNNFDRFNHFDNNMWMNRFNNFDGRFDNRFEMMPWNNRFHNFDMWLNRFNNNFDGRANNCWWLNSFDWLKNVEAPATWLHSLRFRPAHFLEYYTLTHPVRFLDNSERCEIFLCFDLRGFTLNEINCTLDRNTRCIVVEAKHDVTDSTEGHRVSRHFNRKFFLPECFKKLDLSKCGELRFFCREGFLYVHLPLPMLTKEELAQVRDLTNTRHFELNRPNHLDNADWVNQCHFRPANGLEYYTLTHPLRFSNNWGHCELFYCFDLTCFRRDEIKCTLDRNNRCLVIEAEHCTDDKDQTHNVARKFHRKVMLPKFLEKERLAKLNELRACFTEEGLLYVALPLTGFTHDELRQWNCENMVNNRFHDFTWTSPFFRNSSNVTTKFL